MSPISHPPLASNPQLTVNANVCQAVVLPSGDVIKTRRRSQKSSAGFNVTKLFIGAERTPGTVTKGMYVSYNLCLYAYLLRDITGLVGYGGHVVTIRLAPVLPYRVAMAQFPDVRRAKSAIVEVLNKGVGIRT